MSKRNFILLIIVLLIILLVVFVSLFSSPNSGNTPDNGGTNFLSQFNPFGNGGNKSPANPGSTPTDISGYVPPANVDNTAKLIKVSTMPVAGYGVYQKERLVEVPVPTTPPDTTTTTTTKPVPPATEFAPALRYVDRATGNIYETFADKIAERKFSTTVIPKIYEAFFSADANTVVMRYLKADGKTTIAFVGTLPKEILGGDTTDANEVKGFFLPEGITDLSLSGDSSTIFYLYNFGDNALGTTMNLATSTKTQILNSPFTQWLSNFPNTKLVTLTTKPSGIVPGYVYAVNGAKSQPTQVFGGINGLTTSASPNGKFILYSDSSLSLSVYHTDTKVSVAVGLNTLPEKCSWAAASDSVYCAVPTSIPNGLYPDSWYQGQVSFTDQIWKVNIDTGNATLVADLASLPGGEDIDGIKLSLDKAEKYLFFVNKKDSYLWKLNLQ